MASPPAQSPALPLEDVAAIRAALDAGLPRDQVLSEANLSPEAWEAAQARWLAKLADQAAQGRLETSRRFVALVDASRARADEKARESRRTWKHRKSAPTAIQSLQSPPPAAAPAPPPLPQPAPEWIVAPPATQPAPSTQPAPQTPLAPQVALRDPLPFKPGASPIAVQVKAEPARPLPPLDADPLAGTVILNNPPATARTPLPFQQRAPQPSASASPDKPNATSALDIAKLPRGPALPFPAAKASAAPAPPDVMDDDVGNTTLNVVAVPPPQEALPFKKASPPANAAPAAPPSPEALQRAHGMSLAQYAHLCADVRVHPEYVEQIRAHYGLDAAAWTALHKLWRERFDRDPALRNRWQTLVEQRVAAKR